MDRIINVKVGGNYISKDNKNAGVRGEGNVTNLRITFDEGWKYYAKTVTFWDALGNNPVKRILTTDLIENAVESTEVYLVPIPPEPMAVAGTLTFVIDGFYGEFVKNDDGEYEIVYEGTSKRQRSISDKLVVKDAPIADNAGEPTDPIPTPEEQFQSQFDSMIDTIQEAIVSGAAAEMAQGKAEEAQGKAETARDVATSQANNAKAYAERAENLSVAAQGSAVEAEDYANKASEAVGKTNYIGSNGNWFAWDSKLNSFYDTGVRAQSGTVVYLGENPPNDADVWIYPDGEGDVIDQMHKDIASLKEIVNTLYAKSLVRTVNINLPASGWIKADDSQHYQVVSVDGITEHSKVDLQPTLEQLTVFYEKDITFVAVNDGGTVYVYCIGQKPANNYTLQATVTEVMANG